MFIASIIDLIKGNYHDFFRALVGKEPKIPLNELIIHAGFEPKYIFDFDKWNFLSYDEQGEPLNRNKQIKAAAIYLKDIIILLINTLILK